VNHLKIELKDHRNDVVFVGYQAEGTPGREILAHANGRTRWSGWTGGRITIRAGVHALSGYPAHADQEGLIEWVESMGDKPKRIKLVHGEPAAWKCLAEMLRTLECSVD
jgi:metallo-beta-lactamase family protein